MIKRYYFINARCTESNGYCYVSRLMYYTSIFSSVEDAYSFLTKETKKELLGIRPNGNFEVTSFNRVN